MRAMAYAESHDGDCAGGLWGVNGEMITTIKKNKTLLDRYGRDYCNSKPEFISLSTILTVENMKNPEYSGLAAALYLKYIAEKITQKLFQTLIMPQDSITSGKSTSMEH